MTTEINENTLEDALAKIEAVRNWSPRVISKLENTVRADNEQELFRISPLKWAKDKNVDEHEAIDLFLHSTKAGLFYMEWNVICPCCAKITQSLVDLHSVEADSTCVVCFRRDQVNIDDSVQISFTVSQAVRSLRFHDPEKLSLEEYCFNYLFESGAIMNGLLSFKDVYQWMHRHLAEIAPGESASVDVEAGEGIITFVDVFGDLGFGLVTAGEPSAETQVIKVKMTDSELEVPLPLMNPGEFDVGPLSYAGTFYVIRPGKVTLEIERSAGTKTAFLVGFYPLPLEGFEALDLETFPPEFVEFFTELQSNPALFEKMYYHEYTTPRLTAKRLFTCQTFHDLFRAEVFRESEGFGVRDVTFLFTDLKSSTQMYQEIGDLNAFALVREHYGVLNRAILNQHGTVVKTIGDAIMATFNKPADAVSAGLEMLKEMQPLNEASHHTDLILKVGIHRGKAISVTLNERIDYFGQTVNMAARIQGSAGGNEIYLSEEVHGAPGVEDLLKKSQTEIESFPIELKGIEEEVTVFKVTALA